MAIELTTASASVLQEIRDAVAGEGTLDLRNIKTGSFTAAAGTSYVTYGTTTVTDPTTKPNGDALADGDAYQVTVADGTTTINSVAYTASRLPILRVYVSSAWTTLAPTADGYPALTARSDGAPDVIVPAVASTCRSNLGAGWIGDTIFQASTLSAFWGAVTGGPVLLRQFASGRWYCGDTLSGNCGTIAQIVNTIRLVPFSVGIATSFTYAGLEVTTAASGATMRLGLFTSTDYGMTLTLHSDWGTIDCSTTGEKSIAISPTLTLPPATYWLASLARGAQATFRSRYINQAPSWVGVSSTGNNTHYGQWLVTNASDNFPATATGEALINSNIPAVYLKTW